MASHPVAVVGLLLLAGIAPYQCGGPDPDEPSRLEDSAGDALYRLAEDFDKAGDRAGRVRVLRFLVARYPSNRHAAAAKEDLAKLGEPIESGPAAEGTKPPPAASSTTP